MPAGTGYSGLNLYQAAIGSLSLDSSVNDGNNATGPDLTAGPPARICCIVDLGADQLITQIDMVTGWSGNITRSLEWATAAAPTTWHFITLIFLPGHAGVFSTALQSKTSLSITARYVRYSVSDDVGRVSVRELDITGAPMANISANLAAVASMRGVLAEIVSARMTGVSSLRGGLGSIVSARMTAVSSLRGVLAGIVSASMTAVSSLMGSIDPAPNISASMVAVSRLAGGILDGTPPTAGGNPAVEWEVRLYDAAGKRIRLPLDWIESCDFELGENGGCLNGTLTVLTEWETLQLTGSERVDVWLWGILIYRGYVRLPQAEASVPERKTWTLYGVMQTLQGYLVRRNFAYAEQTDIGQVFRDLVAFYVQRTGRLPAIQIDTMGVNALGITLQQFDATDRDFAQAMNDLCAVSPGSLVWGCDVAFDGGDRIFLRPRTSTVKYKYAVGDKVSAFVYPTDTNQVVNGLFVTGGDQQFPNLAPNASFERVVAPGETTSNLLLSPSFEDASGGTIPNWGHTGNPTAYLSASRTGEVSLKLDNNPSFESIYQHVFIPALPAPANYAVYARCPSGQTWHLNATLQLRDASNGLLASQTFPTVLVPPDGLWNRYSGSWLMPVTAGAVKVTLTFNLNSGDSGGGGVDDGLELDDAALWFGDVLAESWQPGQSLNATFAVLDWQNRDIDAYDGDIVIKVQPVIASMGGYVELCTTAAARISVKAKHTYTVAVFVSGDAVNPPELAIGARVYDGSTLVGPPVGAKTFITSGRWSLLSFNFSTATGSEAEIFVRFFNGEVAYIDAIALYENALPQVEAWYPDKSYVAHVIATDYAGLISSPAAASITNYGLREKAESNANIIDQASLDAFAIGYFNSHAVPAIQAKLSIFGPTAPLLLDGSVQIINLPAEPPALFPSRVRYQIQSNAITIDADLGNERPDMALLLQQAAKNALI